MPPIPNILADSDSAIFKLIGFGIVGLIMLISWIVKAVSKSQKDSQHAEGQMSWQDILRQMGGQNQTWTGDRMQQRPTPPPMPPPIQQQPPMFPPPIIPPPPPPPRQKSKKRKPRIEPAPVMEVPAATVVEPAAHVAIPDAPDLTRRQKPHPVAAMLAGKSLRQQFVLMEVLKPPLALRDGE